MFQCFDAHRVPVSQLAGADIKEMQQMQTFSETYNANFLYDWNVVSKCRKPIIAAVNGYAVCLRCVLCVQSFCGMNSVSAYHELAVVAFYGLY
jgi:hypothetical protein